MKPVDQQRHSLEQQEDEQQAHCGVQQEAHQVAGGRTRSSRSLCKLQYSTVHSPDTLPLLDQGREEEVHKVYLQHPECLLCCVRNPTTERRVPGLTIILLSSLATWDEGRFYPTRDHVYTHIKLLSVQRRVWAVDVMSGQSEICPDPYSIRPESVNVSGVGMISGVMVHAVTLQCENPAPILAWIRSPGVSGQQRYVP